MDSKLRRAAILASLAAVFLLLVVVLLMNTEAHDTRTSRGSTSQASDSSVENAISDASGQEADTQTAVEGQIGNDLSAFLKDNTFFDEEVNPILEAAKDNSNRLSLIMTSVEKDLRIQIVDMAGNPVTGESFYVSLEGKGEYKDLDKDGIIYIGDLDAGEYYVELLPIAGYRVPTNATRIRVKDRVEYLAIEDIMLLIKTEDEIDAEAEDTAVQDATEDADKTEIKRIQTAQGNNKLGIDVSKWNGDIDWDRVKNAGVSFAIVRAGYRGSKTGVIVEDPFFRANMRAAASADVQTGVYFFTQATSEVEAVEEASAVLELISDYHLDYPIYIDTEGAGGDGRADGLDVETRTLVCEAFCRTIENAGYSAGVYASRNWYNQNLTTKRLEKYNIWLAEYRSAPLYQGYYKMWQYTSKGTIDGIKGNVDLDIAYE